MAKKKDQYEGEPQLSTPISSNIEEFRGNTQIANLKTQLAKARTRISQLESKLVREKRPELNLYLDNRELRLQKTYTTAQGVRINANKPIVELPSEIGQLVPLLKPLVAIANAYAQGRDLAERKQSHVIGLDGKLTKQVEKDENDNVVLLPSLGDRFVNSLKELISDEALKPIFDQLGEELGKYAKKAEKLKAQSEGR